MLSVWLRVGNGETGKRFSDSERPLSVPGLLADQSGRHLRKQSGNGVDPGAVGGVSLARSTSAHTWACLWKATGMTSCNSGAIRIGRGAYPTKPMLVILVDTKRWSFAANQ